jgi:4-azaleucine resistance transporter AzlC
MAISVTVTFTTAGLRRGFIRTLPVAGGVAMFGAVFGLLAGQKGIGLVETGLMSALVFAGASQMLALELWDRPVPALTIILAAAIINARYLMMTAALKPWLSRLSPARAYGSLFFTADENWAISIAEMRTGGTDAAFYLGSGLALWIFWLASSLLGRGFGALLPEPATLGLDFIGPAVFLALATALWRGRGDALPWTIAGATSLAAAWFLPGAWYLVLGGLAGSLVGALRDAR